MKIKLSDTSLCRWEASVKEIEKIAIPKSKADVPSLYHMVCKRNKRKVNAKDFLADDVLEYTSDGSLMSALTQEVLFT